MNKRNKIVQPLLLGIVFSFFSFLGLFLLSSVPVSGEDLLDKVYDEPQNYGYASEADAEDLLDTKVSLSIGGGSPSVGLKESVVVKTSKFMLRVAVVLGIAMLLYSGIKITLAFGDEGKLKEALKHLGFVLLGLFLALMSVAIVYIIISITRTNLDVI